MYRWLHSLQLGKTDAADAGDDEDSRNTLLPSKRFSNMGRHFGNQKLQGPPQMVGDGDSFEVS